MEGRVRALDGVRGLALVAVLIFHAAPSVLPGGFLGVEAFFVLSGFLLMSLLVDEHRRTGDIDLGGYASRRIRRIMPALLTLLTVLAFLGLFLAPEDAHGLASDIITSATGVVNWHLFAGGTSYFGQLGRPPLVRHLWSIAVELQAYVLLPFVALYVVRRSRRVAIASLAAVVAGSATLMGVLAHTVSTSRAYYGTDTRIGALITGALLAVVLSRKDALRVSDRVLAVAAFVAGAVLIELVVFVHDGTPWLYPTGFLLTQLCTATLITAAVRGTRSASALAWGPLRWLGLRSYGIYLWHWPLVALLRPGIDVSVSRWVTAPFTVAAALLLGALSYRYIERPFLGRTWRRIRSMPFAHASALAWAITIVALITVLVRTTPVDPIAQSLAEGERTVASQETHATVSVEAGSPKATSRPSSGVVPVRGRRTTYAAPAPAPKFTGPKPGTVHVAAVGDSVMLGGASKLKERLGPAGYIDAVKGRQFRQGVDVARSLDEHKQIGRALIVHLGNNGPAKPEDIETMLGAVKDIPYVLFTTVRVDKGWQDQVNQALRDAASRHPKQVKIVDWYGASNGHRDWFYSDGTHVNPTGAQAYANLLGSAVPPPPTPTPKPTPTPTPKPTPTPTPSGLGGILPGKP